MISAVETGTVSNVGVTGRYKVFDNAFGAAPVVVTTPIQATADGGHVPRRAAGSFRIARTTAGTSDYNYIAYGSR